jgi:integrase
LETISRRKPFAMRDKKKRLFPFSKRYFQYLFEYYRHRAGLPIGLSSHSLRRFTASRVAQITGDSRMAASRLRHRESVTYGYINFPPEKQIALLNKVEPVW